MHTIDANPEGSAYRGLIDWAMKYSSTAVLVVRNTIPLSDAGNDALVQLRPFLLASKKGTSWPGTKLLSGFAMIHQYQTSDFLGVALKRLATSLFDWQQPDRPEDLSFLRSDGRVLLGTVAHEHDAFLDIAPTLASELATAVPSLRLRLA